MFRETRRKDRLIDEESGRKLLQSGEYGILSVLGDDDYPYGVPVSYVFEDNSIYIHGFLSGHKVDSIKKHSKVCFTVVGDTEVLPDQISTNYISAVAFGKAEVLLPGDSEAERQKAFVLIADKYIPGEAERTAEYTRKSENSTSIIKIVIEHLTCKQRSSK